jgi:hypothetical protein
MMPAITKTTPSAMIQPDLARNGSSAVSCAVLGDPVKLDMVFDSRFCGVKQPSLPRVKSGYERPADIYKICRYARTAEAMTQSIIDWPDAHDTPGPDARSI